MSAADSGISRGRIGLLVALVGTAIAISLHVTFGLNAGALWRDEVNSVDLASVNTLPELWANLDYDSFPVLFFLILRAVVATLGSPSDRELRILGLLVGVLILAALWLNARTFRIGCPLISLALIGLSPTVIRYGDSIRAYGLGILFLILTFAALWKLLEAPTPKVIALTALTSVASVQSVYYNSFLLFAISCGAIAVALRRRQFRTTLIILATGAIAAASMLPYLATIRRVKEWSFLFYWPVDRSLLWRKFAEAVSIPGYGGGQIWIGLIAVGLAIAAWVVVRRSRNQTELDYDRTLFALVTLVLGIFGYVAFLKTLSYLTQPWHYVLLVCFIAVCLDISLASAPGGFSRLLLRPALAILLIGVSALPAWQALKFRQTNIDVIAGRLNSFATKQDLILLNTWNYGISLRRYYHGKTEWVSIPPVSDLRFHRCDIVKRQMMSTDPLAPVRGKIAHTLAQGHTVWLVGGLNFLPANTLPLCLPPGFDGTDGWIGGNFYRSWSEQIAFLLQRHGRIMGRIPIPTPQDRPVSRYENIPLTAFRGWHSEQSLGVSEVDNLN